MRTAPQIAAFSLAVGIAASAVVLASGAATQPLAAEWTGVGKIRNGSCGDGALVHVREQAGSMDLSFMTAAGEPFAEVRVPLAGDGSAQAQFKGFLGATTLEVPAGTGKRPVMTRLVYGKCRWLWEPR